MPLILFLGEASAFEEWGPLLEEQGYRVGQVQDPAAPPGSRPALLIRSGGPAGPDGMARDRSSREGVGAEVPILDVVEDAADPEEIAARHGDAEDWVYRSRAAAELPARVARLLRRARGGQARDAAPIDAKFLALAVHDLRTPLNVVGLSLRMIDQAVPREDPDLLEDLRFVDENFKQIERMLAELSDYSRLYEVEGPLAVTEFSPARLVGELLDERAMKDPGGSPPIRLRVEENCPPEVTLDPGRARIALQYALINALASSQDTPVDVILRGGDERLITEIRIDRPPPASVKSLDLAPDAFERLFGTTAERRGLDLAIAARVGELFGGAARLEAVDGRGTAIILDWPARLPRG